MPPRTETPQPAPTSWPSFTTEIVEWRPADADYGPRAGRSAHSGPYEAAVAPRIADASVHLSSQVAALVAEASAEIARFDGETHAATTSFAALLLRTEAASSSQIENLTSSSKAIAMAELGRKGRANADEIVATVTAMTRALAAVDHLDGQAILEMHRALMAGHASAVAGRWRADQVWIGGSSRSPHGAAFVAPVHRRVPAAIDDLVAFMSRDDMPLLAQAALTHAQFESIHPFPDGNGRTGRALLHAQLRHGGLTREAIVPVSAGLLTDTDRYFEALTVYRSGDVEPVVVQVCEAVFPALASSRMLIADVTGARAVWDDRIRARRGAAAWALADLVTTRPVVDVRLAAEKLGVTPVNAQLAIDRLVEDGVLEQVGRGMRDRVWQAPEILAAMDRFAARSGHRGW
ncbi:Fic family protein [Cellulomonas carbonis]|uniref:Fic family protein n=1 Tax=Cellulomonas carbonis T26 TaxID=947969 RepID=A0A0A0BS93_9CELL|nr:Fic family protein [Cellulomonas carbonis]KGM10024.1 Fic family protein [Cellulomonas carbonis T26]GGC17476.1 Fic family protein [Cellulomonas carbonis]